MLVSLVGLKLSRWLLYTARALSEVKSILAFALALGVAFCWQRLCQVSMVSNKQRFILLLVASSHLRFSSAAEHAP